MEEREEPPKEKHRALLVFIPVAISAFLRVYPSLYNGAPWGTDGWSLLRISNQLLVHTPVAITGSAIFGYYDVYWPAASIFGAMSSLIFNLQPIIVMPFIIPLAASFTALFLFVIVERVCRSSKIACVASLIFTTASFDSIFTASVTKETYAEPLFMVGILLAFLLLFGEKSNRIDLKGIGIFALIVAAMAMSHHATSLIFAIIVLSFALGRALIGFGGVTFGYTKYFEANLANVIALPVISGVIVAGYLFAYAIVALPFQITSSEVTYLTSFLILAFATAILFSFERKFRKVNFLIPVLLFVAGVSLFVLSEFTHLFPLAPLIPQPIAFDSLPYLITGGIVVVGYAIAQRIFPRQNFTFLAIWIAVPMGLFGYAVFAAPDEAVNLYRLFTFLYAPVSIIAAIAFIPILQSRSNRTSRGARKASDTAMIFARIGAVALIIVIALLGSYQSYSAAVQNQNFLGGQWAYKPADYAAATWTNQRNPSNMSIAGDTKISYLFSDYFEMSINVQLGYNDLTTNLGKALSSPLVVYGTMQQNGYNLFLYGEPLPSGWQASLSNSSSLVYDNGNDQIWN